MYFVAVCWDRPNVGQLREKAHSNHLRYKKEHSSHVQGGGPLEDVNGNTVGTLFFLDFTREEEALMFLENEPFHQAKCFGSSLLRRYRQMQPAAASNYGQVTADEAELELRQQGMTS